jgi:hypothetical protein
MGIMLSIPEGISQAWSVIESAFSDLAPFLIGLFHGQGRQKENKTDRNKSEPLKCVSKNDYISTALNDAVLHCSTSEDDKQPVVVTVADDETRDDGDSDTNQIKQVAVHRSTSDSTVKQRLQVDGDTANADQKQSLLPHQRANSEDMSSSASTASEQGEYSPLNPRASRPLLSRTSSSQQQQHRPSCCCIRRMRGACTTFIMHFRRL